MPESTQLPSTEPVRLPEFGGPGPNHAPPFVTPVLNGPYDPNLPPNFASQQLRFLPGPQSQTSTSVPTSVALDAVPGMFNSPPVVDTFRSIAPLFVLTFWLVYIFRPKPPPKTRTLSFNNCYLGMPFREWLEKHCTAGVRNVSLREYDGGRLCVESVGGPDLRHPAPVVRLDEDYRHFSVRLSPHALNQHRLAGEPMDFTYVFRCQRPDLLDSRLIKFSASVDARMVEPVRKQLLKDIGVPEYSDEKRETFWLGARAHKAALVCGGEGQAYTFTVSVAV